MAPPHAYAPRTWRLFCDPVARLRAEEASYPTHVYLTLRFAAMQWVAAAAGFTHAACAWLVPFIAEEVVVELGALVEAKREKGAWPPRADAYAFSPSRWVWVLDGLEHVRFSGGSYYNHAKFACWASGQALVGGLASAVHAVWPFLLPQVGEEAMMQLGGLVRQRRMLRNAQPDDTFVNPENLDDYLGEGYRERFSQAEETARHRGDVGQDAQGKPQTHRVKVQLGPGQEAKFLEDQRKR